jgi:iron(II)-dependent oxidoreductase
MEATRTAMARRMMRDAASLVLFARPGLMRRLAEGCLPLLVDYTFEDKAAKGLRAAPTAPRQAQHFTALEMIAEAPRLLLLGEAGAGKSVLAQRLVLHLAGEALGDARFNLATLGSAVPRGDDGPALPEAWVGEAPFPVLLGARAAPTLAAIAAALAPFGETSLLLVLDEAEALGAAGPAVLERLAADRPGLRILALAEAASGGVWRLPAGFARHRLTGLLPAQREAWRVHCQGAPCQGGPGTLPANPGLLSLALALPVPVPEAGLAAAWIEAAPGLSAADRDALGAAAAEALAEDRAGLGAMPAGLPAETTAMLDRPFLLAPLAARHLATRPLAEAVARFRAAPGRWREALRGLAGLAGPEALAEALLADRTADAALLAARLVADPPPAQRAGLVAALATAIAADTLAVPDRVAAGRHLARLGDPRDLAALCAVPAGEVTMGSTLHPNSAPPHRLRLPAFRIGRYPVTNALFARFAAATGLPWRAAAGLAPEQANMPATDVTWHEARACCAWLTGEWRREGRIGAAAVVRLPTEPEWEYAARGDRPVTAAPIHPWAGPWREKRCNGEEAGLNAPCAVGLFPAGASPFGAEDMAGQVWEWCSTLWGEDMASPRFRYPYADDGREDAAAGPLVRRVLRGGCFSSPREKANVHYRGSLEPDGFWRGNGFRVVVAPG